MTSDYEKKKAEILKKEKQLYTEFQKLLAEDKLNLYGFKIYICNPENETINTDRGFFTSALVFFKELLFWTIVPVFDSDFRPGTITGLSLRKNSINHEIESVNYSFSEAATDKEIVVKSYHKTLQSCLDEAERVRQIIADFYKA